MKIQIIIVSILIIFFCYKLYTYTRSSFENYNSTSFNSVTKELQNNIKIYVKTIRKSEIFFKTGKNIEKNQLYDAYINSIIPFTDKEISLLNKHVDYINTNFNKYEKLTKTKWNFVKLKNRLEKGMPFTIGKHIFLSKKVINKLFNDEKNNIINLLIHEKIHIIQRFSQQLYNKIYIDDLNYTYLPNLKITRPWDKLQLSNPDGIDIKWGIKYRNKIFLPMLIIDKYDIKQVVIQLNFKNNIYITTQHFMDIYDFPPFNKYPKDISLYHPNEIVAYMIPKLIIM